MQAGPVLSLSSPSFNSYSSSHLAEIAARVVEEFRQEQDPDTDFFSWATQDPLLPPQETTNSTIPLEQEQDHNDNNNKNDDNDDEDEDDEEDEGEFEFAFVCREPESSPISADEIFYNGQIRPVYPIFNQDLLLNDSHTTTGNYNYSNTSKTPPSSSSSFPLSSVRRLPLRKLMLEEREEVLVEPPTSSSSSESDELDGVPSGTYCVWTPKPAETNNSPDRCKIKSNSTGSSKRWKFRDLLYRSHSDGKDTFAFLTPSKKAEMAKEIRKVKVAHCVSNNKELEDKRKSFLPNRKDMVGFFANVNGLSRSLQPF